MRVMISILALVAVFVAASCPAAARELLGALQALPNLVSDARRHVLGKRLCQLELASDKLRDRRELWYAERTQTEPSDGRGAQRRRLVPPIMLPRQQHAGGQDGRTFPGRTLSARLQCAYGCLWALFVQCQWA